LHDYLAEAGVTISWEQAHWRVNYKEISVRFTRIERDELIRSLNVGVAAALPYYTRNVERSGYRVDLAAVEEAALTVVIAFVHLYNSWRHTYDQHREHTLALSAADLASVSARVSIVYFCTKKFGAQYGDSASALTGLSREELAAFEASQKAFADAK
jgi:hypothetical protein